MTIQILKRLDGEATTLAGMFIKKYSPIAGTKKGELICVPKRDRAMQFESLDEATAFWMQQQGIDADGAPFRPLAIYSVRIE